MPTHFYTIKWDKVVEVTNLVNDTDSDVTRQQVEDFCCADWADGDSHQMWLNNAPAEEIADWYLAGR